MCHIVQQQNWLHHTKDNYLQAAQMLKNTIGNVSFTSWQVEELAKLASSSLVQKSACTPGFSGYHNEHSQVATWGTSSAGLHFAYQQDMRLEL